MRSRSPEEHPARERRAPVLAAVLAAGAGARMGGRAKAALRVGPESFIERIVRSARAAGLAEIVVVRGDLDFAVPEGVGVVRNPLPERGMLSSIHAALDAAEARGAAGLLVWPVDCPRVPEGVLAGLLRPPAPGSPRDSIVVPRFRGRRGHPILFGAALFEALRAAPLDQGARAVLRARADRLIEVEVDAPEVLDDIDTPEDLARIST